MNCRLPILFLILISITVPHTLGYRDIRHDYELGVYDPCPNQSCDITYELTKIREIGANAILVTLVDGDGRALYPSKVLPTRNPDWAMRAVSYTHLTLPTN